MVEWDDKYCMGITIIDEAHKEIYRFINKTIHAKEHDNKEELMEVLEEMTKYALEHFKTEEHYMKEFNYPDYKYHSEEHNDFFNKALAYFDRVVKGEYHVSNELIEYLKQWIVHHIQVTDKKYEDCFKENGLK